MVVVKQLLLTILIKWKALMLESYSPDQKFKITWKNGKKVIFCMFGLTTWQVELQCETRRNGSEKIFFFEHAVY